jgi:hypothetical protein
MLKKSKRDRLLRVLYRHRHDFVADSRFNVKALLLERDKWIMDTGRLMEWIEVFRIVHRALGKSL